MPELLHFPPLTETIRSKKLRDMVKFFGPGAVMASLTIGTGETFFASRGGAVFGYAILWTFALGSVMKGIASYSAMRYFTLTGEHPLDRWAHFPGPRGWFPLFMGLLSIACFPFWLAFVPSTLGTLMNWMFGFGDPVVWGTFFSFAVIALVFTRGYEFLEKTQLSILGLLVLSILFSVFYFKPDWLAVLKGMLIPSVSDYEPWVREHYPAVAARPVWVEITVYIAAIGGGTYDSIGYVGLLREKKWGMLAHPRLPEVQKRIQEYAAKGSPLPISDTSSNVRTGLSWLKAPAIDVIISYSALILFAAGFMIGGARILHPERLIPDGVRLLEYQARFLVDIKPWLLPIYNAGVFLAVFGTLYGAYAVYPRTAYECLRTVLPGFRRASFSRVKFWITIYGASGGLFLMWLPKLCSGIEIIDLPTPAGIVGGVLTLGLWCLAMIWTERRFLPEPLRMRPVLVILTLISGLAMIFLGLKGWWDYGADRFGVFGAWKGYAFLLFMIIFSMSTAFALQRLSKRKIGGQDHGQG